MIENAIFALCDSWMKMSGFCYNGLMLKVLTKLNKKVGCVYFVITALALKDFLLNSFELLQYNSEFNVPYYRTVRAVLLLCYIPHVLKLFCISILL